MKCSICGARVKTARVLCDSCFEVKSQFDKPILVALDAQSLAEKNAKLKAEIAAVEEKLEKANAHIKELKSALSYDEVLYVVWQNPETREDYVFGCLNKIASKGSSVKYEFYYDSGVHEAMRNGFTPLIGMSNIEMVYEDDDFFDIFRCRVPDPKRKDIDKLLEKYGMWEYDEFEFLKRTGGILPTDTYRFVTEAEAIDIFEDMYGLGDGYSWGGENQFN